jgi:hypothetical protein
MKSVRFSSFFFFFLSSLRSLQIVTLELKLFQKGGQGEQAMIASITFKELDQLNEQFEKRLFELAVNCVALAKVS